MTAVIVAAQGHDTAGRRKTCARASTASEGATWEMTAHEFALQRAHPGAPPKIRRVRRVSSMSGTNDAPATNYASLVKGEGVELPYPMSRFSLRHNPQRLAVLRGEQVTGGGRNALASSVLIRKVFAFYDVSGRGRECHEVGRAPDCARPTIRQSVR
jgi:hypothetical protein